MPDVPETVGTPDGSVEFEHRPTTAQSFENALAKARNGTRLTVDDAVELLTTGTDRDGIDHYRKEQVLEAADRRRAEVVGDEVTFVANLNNNVTTACNTGCLFCNFKDRSEQFRSDYQEDHGGFTKTPSESREIVRDALDRGIYEVCSVSGLHPALALDDEHREILETSDRGDLNYRSPDEYEKDPATYCEQIRAMNVGDVHLHSMTPEEAYHARRGTDWSYEEVYGRLQDAGLDSVPGTAAEILVDEVRDVICPGKIGTDEWLEAMEAAASVGLDMTSTMMYGHVENERHRALHLQRIRDLQDRTGAITEFVPLSFVHEETPLYERGMVDGGASIDEDELLIAVSRLFLDNVDHIQSSWVKYGDTQGLKMLTCGADDFMGTILSEEITKRAGGDYGEFRSFQEYADMITAIGRTPVERSTDYEQRRVIDPDADVLGPQLGPQADGTPLLD
ncbi:FO synthase [Haloarcula hispanica N601]|uniref:5-amino-6-(D-ribitylamino)uracil--L-tyrosine 4-hydroxyphenyl transferase n=3 Tax=Haloarcula hispanica TaxID=51589 RepID=V5TI15_HALHI|nr:MULTISPECIES: 7,8-didemethyl-8-hydroxy-5-deazariboflavin synthase subunit CofH [Haloarcula]AEM56144.1 FO synthase subunit 2 [Haloarcula hispanica ATCC 33960]AHB64956.1 FO synthase [Haloarcula hispanica N601]KAA9408067.1 7,8-didemethyl-8-hydroxy-5-deazariboflavin synthase subunit CofH [Haloarcula sp. CBA1131]KZX49560.1 FO synthase [Haloarcula sp. K1]MCJ0620908.1 7,8-didemethyl-8-hydroxy-5-deazariboflavin synthase subunit CofH [Haloarcula hispanica]